MGNMKKMIAKKMNMGGMGMANNLTSGSGSSKGDYISEGIMNAGKRVMQMAGEMGGLQGMESDLLDMMTEGGKTKMYKRGGSKKKAGTKKGMLRKTSRKAYMKK
tara:strand:+ start:310 stop:621 length:312 start_codon:yes stop_codon:yes gene_type:complete